MIRLLIALAVLGATLYFMVGRTKHEEKPQEIYREQVEQIKGLEQQMLDDARVQMEKADAQSR